MNFGISVFVTLAHIASNLNSLKHEINDKEKIGFTKYSREKKFWPTKYLKEKISDPRIPTRKFWTHEIPTRKKFWIHEVATKAQWHDGTKPTRPMIAPRDPRNLAQSLTEVYFTFSQLCLISVRWIFFIYQVFEIEYCQ